MEYQWFITYPSTYINVLYGSITTPNCYPEINIDTLNQEDEIMNVYEISVIDRKNT